MYKSKIQVVGAALCGALVCGAAQAENFDTGIGDMTAAWISNITGGLAMRTKSPSCSLTGDPNANGCGSAANTAVWGGGDDGDLNYRKNQVYSAYASLTSELYLNMPSESLKFLARGTGLYDFAAASTDRTPLSSEAERQAVRNILLLDFWGEKGFQIADQSAHVRLGNQVINWGESQYAMGGINATNSLDLQKLDIPGTLLKQALLPAPMVSFASSLPAGWSTEGYLQWMWNGDRFPPVGTFFSTSNGLGRGAVPFTSNTNNYNVSAVDGGSIAGANSNNIQAYNAVNQNLVNGNYAGAPYFAQGYQPYTVNPGNRPQVGLRFGYKPSGADVSFGFYYENYTDKMPVATYMPSGATQYSYLTNRSLYGVSANFQAGQWAFGTELSYRPHDAVSMSGCFTQGTLPDYNANSNAGANGCQGWKDFSKYEFIADAQLQQTKGDPLLNLLGASSGIFSAELAVVEYPGVDAAKQYSGALPGTYQMPDAGYYYWLNNKAGTGYPIAAGGGTSTSAGLVLDYNVTYDNTIIPGWAVNIGTTFYDSFTGVTPTLYMNYASGYKSTYSYIGFYQNPLVWQAGISYAAFFGGNAYNNAFSDRNTLGLYVTRFF